MIFLLMFALPGRAAAEDTDEGSATDDAVAAHGAGAHAGSVNGTPVVHDSEETLVR